MKEGLGDTTSNKYPVNNQQSKPNLQQVDQEEDTLFLQEVIFRDIASHDGTPVADTETHHTHSYHSRTCFHSNIILLTIKCVCVSVCVCVCVCVRERERERESCVCVCVCVCMRA